MTKKTSKRIRRPMPDNEIAVMVHLVKRLTDKGVITGEGNPDRTKRFEIHLSDPGDWDGLIALEKCVGKLMIIAPIEFEEPPGREDEPSEDDG